MVSPLDILHDFRANIRDLSLPDFQIFLVFQNSLHASGVLRLVCLRAKRMYSRTLRLIQHF